MNDEDGLLEVVATSDAGLEPAGVVVEPFQFETVHARGSATANRAPAVPSSLNAGAAEDDGQARLPETAVLPRRGGVGLKATRSVAGGSTS